MVATTARISPSLEDYLEGVLIVKEKKGIVRVKDLAKLLNVRASSVVEALQKLKERKLIVQQHYGYVELTPEGTNVAKTLYERHNTLTRFFHEVLGIDEKTSEEDACKIEHYLSRETFERIVKFIKFIETCPLDPPEWLSSFHYFVKHRKRPPKSRAKHPR